MEETSYFDNKYREICSEKTLQSDSRGFFNEFVKCIESHAGEKWIKHTFGNLTSNRDRLKCIYTCKETKDAVTEILQNVQEIYRKHDIKTSQSKRLEAEKILANGDSKKALQLFSQSILRCPGTDKYRNTDSEKTLSLSLWGRSQALFNLNEPQLAVYDIQLALKEGLPEYFKGEAYLMMATCYKALNDVNRVKVCLELARKLGKNDENIEEMMKVRFETPKERKKVPELPNTHEIYRSASNKIKIKTGKDVGRHAVANNNIKTGEPLIVEEPYAACLLPEKYGTHCHHCFKRLTRPIGCSDCSSVAFCSDTCRSTALTTYHKYECKYLDLLIGSGMSILAHVALRMITQFSFERSMEIYENLSKENVYKLCTNSDKRSSVDFLQRTLMAAFLLRCLQRCGYFPTKPNETAVVPTEEEEYRIGEMLLLNLQILQFNAHEIFETVTNSNKKCLPFYVGVGVFPTAALLNHDCQPTVMRHFVGKKIVIRAAKPLNPDEEISENYGPIFTRKNLAERQRTLWGRYWFKCCCNACRYNWPSYDTGLESVSEIIRCPSINCEYSFTLPVSSEMIKCPKCKKDVSLSDRIAQLKWCQHQYVLGQKASDEGDTETTIKTLCAALDIFYKVSGPPHKCTHKAEDILKKCYNM